MDKQLILKKLKELRETSKKRKFSQTFDIIINLNNLDLKKPENKIDVFLVLPNQTGKKVKICGLVDKELSLKSKEILDHTVLKDEFNALDKKVIKQLSSDYTYFISQANIMTDVAKTFGRVFGPKGKMPNPKAGCVVPPTADLKNLKERLEKTIRFHLNTELILKAPMGKEDMDDELIADNIFSAYNNLIQNLPQERNNIKNVLVKFTMSKPIKIE
jgi:large subunit ribosomal protein L1|tara:strand:- start:862 stop:1509 length:648 start_codon:yes stop_codon:yes gene_type:complete